MATRCWTLLKWREPATEAERQSRYLKPDIAYIFHHVYFTNQRLGFKCLNDLFAKIIGKAPTEEEFTSISTIRCHISRHNAIDRYDKGQEYVQRMEILSPYGNRRFFGSCSDDSKHGGVGSALNTHLLITSFDGEVVDNDSTNSWKLVYRSNLHS